MGKFRIKVEKQAQDDLAKHRKVGNQANINKINKIFDDLAKHPETGVGQPEKLKHDLAGLWSRRINQKDRVVYRIDNQVVTVFVLTAMGHYGDK